MTGICLQELTHTVKQSIQLLNQKIEALEMKTKGSGPGPQPQVQFARAGETQVRAKCRYKKRAGRLGNSYGWEIGH